MADRDVSVVVKAIDKVSEVVAGIRTGLEKFRDGIGEVGRTIAAAFAIERIVEFARSCVDKFAESEASVARLELAVKNAGGSFEAFAPQADAAIEAVAKLGLSTAADTREALVRLISVTGDTAGSVKNLGLVADVAAMSGKNLSESAQIVGSVMQGNVRPLREFGIFASTSADGLRLLGEQSHGFAETKAATLEGRLGALNVKWVEFKERLGGAIASSLDLNTDVTNLTTTLDRVGKAVDVVLLPLRGFWQILESLAQTAIVAFDVIWNGAKTAFGGLLEILGTVGVSLKSLLSKAGLDIGAGVAEQWQAAGKQIREAGVGELKADLSANMDVLKDIWVGGQEEMTQTQDQHGAARRRLTQAEQRAIIALSQTGFDGLSAAQQASLANLEAELKAHGGATLRLTKEQAKAIDTFMKDEHRQRAADQKQADAATHEIQKLVHESALALLTEAHKKTLEMEARFNELIMKLDGDDRENAIAAYKEYLANRLLYLAGFTEKNEQAWRKVGLDHVTNGNLIASSLENLGAKLDVYTYKTTGMTKADIEATRAKYELNQSILAVTTAVVDGINKFDAMAHDLVAVLGQDLVNTIDQVTSGINGLGESIRMVLGGDWAGGIAKGIGAIVALGQTIFGGDAALARELKSNSDKLQHLVEVNTTLAQVNEPGRKLAAIESALKSVDLKAFSVGGSTFAGLESQILGEVFLKSGVSGTDLDEVAKTLGIQIRDGKGNLNAQALQQLLQALGGIKPGYAKTFAGQRSQISEGVSIGSITDELGAAIQLISDPNFGVPAIAKALASASTSGGKIGALQGLFSNIGGLTKSDLGGASQTEFVDTIKWLIGLLGKGGGGTVGGPTVPQASVSANLAAAIGTDTTSSPVGTDFAIALNKGLNLLTSIDSNVALLPPALTSIDSSLHRIDASISGGIHISGVISDPNKIAAAVEDKLASLQEAQIRAIDQALARRQLLAASALGKATRVA